MAVVAEMLGELMSEVTIKGVTWCRVDGGWWCTSPSRLANGYDAERRRTTTALDEVVRLREENARLRTVIEEALDGWKNSTAGWRDANNRNEELIGKLRDVLAAIRELDGAQAEHYRRTNAEREVVRLRTVIEEAAAFLVADLCPTGEANTADVMAVVARLRTAVEAQS